jgi:hypothetical protein
LGVGGLIAVAEDLLAVQKKFALRFDHYFIDKRSHAVAFLFDAAFKNDAMPSGLYWTSLRFPVIELLSSVVDEDILRESWRLQLLPLEEIKRAPEHVSNLMSAVLRRIEGAKIDPRLREVLEGVTLYGIQNPLELGFGTSDPRLLSPNVVGFEFALMSITTRLKAAKRKALAITVDRQLQFNLAQTSTYQSFAARAALTAKDRGARESYIRNPAHDGMREQANSLIWNFPEANITVSDSCESVGLQIVDVYLWLANRLLKGDDLPPELHQLAYAYLKNARTDGVSIAGMMNRWRGSDTRVVLSEHPEAYDKLVEIHRNKMGELRVRGARGNMSS